MKSWKEDLLVIKELIEHQHEALRIAKEWLAHTKRFGVVADKERDTLARVVIAQHEENVRLLDVFQQRNRRLGALSDELKERTEANLRLRAVLREIRDHFARTGQQEVVAEIEKISGGTS